MDYSLPIRIRWDVDFRGKAAPVKRIARQIRAVAPLFVELRIHGRRGVNALSAISADVHECGSRIQATVALFPGAEAALRWGYPIDFVWAVEAGIPFAARLPEAAKAVSFAPDEETIGALPGVLAEFGASRAATLHIPNVNAIRAAAEKGHVPLPRPAQIEAAAESAARSGIDFARKKLIVHDYFLWKALRGMRPDAAAGRIEFDGCQAASALAHVDWDGNVYPCDSLPIRLGNLLEGTFREIWESPARMSVLSAIRAAPGDCEPCVEYAGCRGGCRGLAYLAARDFDAPDPSCAGPAIPPRES